MDLFKNFYADLYSVGSLISTFFDIFLAYLFLITIREKSKATFHVGLAFLYTAIFNFAYFISGIVYTPTAAFHRWLTVSMILFSATHLNMLIFYIHEEKYHRFGKGLLITQYIITILTSIVFFVKTFNAEKIYHFAGHYWDFATDDISKKELILNQVPERLVPCHLSLYLYIYEKISSCKLKSSSTISIFSKTIPLPSPLLPTSN
ncbi:MAG: hypothetical protein GY754_19140 [bacterium]|nr:hypothetical protein [bacterium]